MSPPAAANLKVVYQLNGSFAPVPRSVNGAGSDLGAVER